MTYDSRPLLELLCCFTVYEVLLCANSTKLGLLVMRAGMTSSLSVKQQLICHCLVWTAQQHQHTMMVYLADHNTRRVQLMSLCGNCTLEPSLTSD